MNGETVVCVGCGERYESDLFTGDPGETFVCPMCGTLILSVQPDAPGAAALQAAAPADAA